MTVNDPSIQPFGFVFNQRQQKPCYLFILISYTTF